MSIASDNMSDVVSNFKRPRLCTTALVAMSDRRHRPSATVRVTPSKMHLPLDMRAPAPLADHQMAAPLTPGRSLFQRDHLVTVDDTPRTAPVSGRVLLSQFMASPPIARASHHPTLTPLTTSLTSPTSVASTSTFTPLLDVTAAASTFRSMTAVDHELQSPRYAHVAGVQKEAVDISNMAKISSRAAWSIELRLMELWPDLPVNLDAWMPQPDKTNLVCNLLEQLAVSCLEPNARRCFFKLWPVVLASIYSSVPTGQVAGDSKVSVAPPHPLSAPQPTPPAFPRQHTPHTSASRPTTHRAATPPISASATETPTELRSPTAVFPTFMPARLHPTTCSNTDAKPITRDDQSFVPAPMPRAPIGVSEQDDVIADGNNGVVASSAVAQTAEMLYSYEDGHEHVCARVFVCSCVCILCYVRFDEP
jgi:hypothetical protein